MDQLTIGNILGFIKQMQSEGMTLKEIAALPIYLGRDDELNGVHTGWYVNLVDANNTEDEDNVYIVEMINEDYGNVKFEKGKAILIS